MAKSLRSKWKRKMRAIKRERYGKKELEKLNMIIENAKEIATFTNQKDANDIEMNLPEVPSGINTKDEPMDVNDNKMNSSNKFPVWMSSHRKKKIIKRNKKLNKIKKKEIKKNLKKRK